MKNSILLYFILCVEINKIHWVRGDHVVFFNNTIVPFGYACHAFKTMNWIDNHFRDHMQPNYKLDMDLNKFDTQTPDKKKRMTVLYSKWKRKKFDVKLVLLFFHF